MKPLTAPVASSKLNETASNDANPEQPSKQEGGVEVSSTENLANEAARVGVVEEVRPPLADMPSSLAVEETPRPPNSDEIATMMSAAAAAAAKKNDSNADPAVPGSSPLIRLVSSATLWLGVGIACSAAIFIIVSGANVGPGMSLAAVAGLFAAVFLAGAAMRAFSPAMLAGATARRMTGKSPQRAAQLAGADILASLSISERVLDADPDARLIAERDGVVAYANSAYFDLAREAGVIGATGLPPRIDRLFAQQGIEATKVFRLCRAAKSAAAAEEILHQQIGLTGGGTRRRFEVAVRPIEGGSDYVSWRLRELALEEEEHDMLAAAYSGFPKPVFGLEKSGQLAWTNGALRHAVGATRSTLRHIDDIILGETGALVKNLCTVDGGEQTALVRNDDGQPYEGAFTAFRKGGVGEGFVCVELVLSEVANEDEALKVSGDLTEAPFGVAVVDGEIGRDAKILQTNKTFKDVFDAASNNAPLTKVFSKETLDELANELKRKAQPGAGPRSVDTTIGEGPAARTFAVYVRPVRRRRGGYGSRRAFLYTVEVTERKRMEDDYVQDQKLKAIGNIAGEVAHDFNNLLQVIHGNCEHLMLCHPAGDPAYQDLVLIRENAQRAANLTKQLLAYSRKQTLTRRVQSITDILVDFSRFLDRMIGEKVKLELINGRGLPPVKVDRTQLETAIMNLAVNARDAMAPEGGRVTIQTSQVSSKEIEELNLPGLAVQDHVLIEVRDTGPGVPEEILEKVFDPFFTTKEEGKGTGLGLSTVHGVIGQMGGTIILDNMEEGGARFCVYLPAHTAEEFEEEQAEAAAAAGITPPAQDYSGSGRILVVEDEPGVRALVVKSLERSGYEVVEVEDGVDALDFLKEDADFQLVISDVMMPIVDGPSMVAEARQDLGLNASILFMSGYAEQAVREQLDAIAGADYIQKPFQMGDLSTKVKDILTADLKETAD